MMKKILAALLALCILLTLTACGNKEKGITITNDLGWALDEVYIVTAGADDWGNSILGQLKNEASGTIYPKTAFNSSKITVDILAIDEFGDSFEVHSVIMNDGNACSLYLDSNSNIAFDVGEAIYTGYWNREEQQENASFGEDSWYSTKLQVYDITGIWEYEDYGVYLLFDQEGYYALVSKDSPEVIDDGNYTIDGDSVLMDSYSGLPEVLLIGNEYLYDSGNNSIHYMDSLNSDLYYSILESLTEEPAYFEQMGYAINYAFGDGNVILSDGAHIYTANGAKYATMPATVSIVRDSCTNTPDGYVEIEFTRVTQLDSDYFPDFMYSNRCTVGTTQWFWDYYTGTQLIESEGVVDGNTEFSDNYHYYEYESQGRTITIDISYYSEWYQKNDFSYMSSMKYLVRMPADYDGLIYTVMPQYGDYASYIANTPKAYGYDRIELRDDPLLQNAIICRVNTAN